MKLALLVAALAAGFTLAYYLIPPKEVLGSYVRDFDKPERKRRMIQLEEQQYRDMGFV